MNDGFSFVKHLIDLRGHLLRAVIAWVLVFIGLFPLAGDIYSMLAKPLLIKLPMGGNMIATDIVATFFIPVKVTMMAAFLLTLPYLLYQIWAFIAPGLHNHEKRLLQILIASSVLLFLAGLAFVYFLVFPVVFGFVVGIAPQGVAVMTDISKYLEFAITLFLVFGLAFETPVLVITLAVMGGMDMATLKQARPYVIVGAFVIGAIFTPPDIVSQGMLALPLWLLFEIGVLFSAILLKAGCAPGSTMEHG